MLHNTIPDDAYLIAADDKGKKVLVNSVGGAFTNSPGVVVVGPYVYKYEHKTEIKTKSRNPMAQKRYKKEERTSTPLWVVQMADGRFFSFVESELRFPRRH
jgi:hypothetical protein